MSYNLSLSELESFDPSTRRGKEWRFCCPLPDCFTKSKNPSHRSLCVDSSSGLWICHRCGNCGLLMEYRQDRKNRVLSYGRYGVQRECRQVLPTRQGGPKAENWKSLLSGEQPIVNSPGETYLVKRGIPVSYAYSAGVCYHPSWYHRGQAVVFPIKDAIGNLVALQGRYLSDMAETKVRSAGPISEGVFTAGNALNGHCLFLCEGPIDALSLCLCGYPAVATCGAKNIPKWLPAFCRGKSVFLGQDCDRGGEEGALLFYKKLVALGVCPNRLVSRDGDWNESLQRYGVLELRNMLFAATQLKPLAD